MRSYPHLNEGDEVIVNRPGHAWHGEVGVIKHRGNAGASVEFERVSPVSDKTWKVEIIIPLIALEK